MKVLWICHFSNPEIRERLILSNNYFERIVRKILRLSPVVYVDFAQWITNGIKEFEKFNSIEMHIISPHYGMIKERESFLLNGVYYHFFKSEDTFFNKVKWVLINRFENKYIHNRRIIKEIISEVNPDIIHMYGAENPYYSIAALDVDINKYPFIISLQTLMSDPDFKNKHIGANKHYSIRVSIEKKILKNVNYIGSTVQRYRDYIWREINPNAYFFKTYLAVAEEVKVGEEQKKFDFVYFAANISKAADIAVEAFAIARKKYPEITLNIIGGTPQPYTDKLKFRIKELGLENCVFFSGKLTKHSDVLNQIKLSKYALLPLKIDIISGTIREAIFSGLPVISTITPGTPELNRKRQSILLSKQGDYHAMADNMILLIENPELTLKLTRNGLISAQERWNNNENMRHLVESYNAIINHHKNGVEIPSQFATSKSHI